MTLLSMNRIAFSSTLTFLLIIGILPAQELEVQIAGLSEQISSSEEYREDLLAKLEELKLQKVQRDLQQYVLPELNSGETVIQHSAMSLVYDERHEQAKWVAHMVLPDIIKGNIGRTNDFRVDPKVTTGTATEVDYFLKYIQEDSTFEYDGYGYDRGHLAPSADFRWSETALSESYFYSNMSPQLPELNRGIWAELEGIMRGYIISHPETELYVVTGPVLHDSLPPIQRSLNKVSIPEKFFKVIVDVKNERGIGFILPNKKSFYPLVSYSASIDEVEALTGINFFPKLDQEIEKQHHPEEWLPSVENGEVAPLDPEELPHLTYNTVQARFFADTGEKVTICGTVVSATLTRNGHIFLNLDKKFPNQIFSVAIWQEYTTNFSYQPHVDLLEKCICVKGKVKFSRDTPIMEIKHEKAVRLLGEYD
ncbi:MAG: DNA/RNA non-specific endonuclease [Bacteroidota bacterium]